MANTYTPLEDKINYLNGLAESRKEEKEVLIILRAIEQGMQDPMCVNKLDDSTEIDDSTKIAIQFLIRFNFTNIELKYIDDLFKLTLTILDKNTNIEIIKKCNYIFNSTALYLLKTNETCEIALNHYKTLINTKKYDVFELIKNLNNTLEEHNCKELNEENIVKLHEFLGDLKKLNKIDDFQIFCMQNWHVSDEKKELFNKLVNNANFKEDEMLEFLFSDKSKLSFDVGIKKSASDNDLISYKKIIEKYVELKTPKNIDLIFGYFCGLCEKDQDTFDDIVLKIDCKSPLYAILPDIVNVSPTDKTVNYLFNLIKSNKFSITDLKSRISKCSKQLLTEIIEYIITKEKPVIYLCLTLISYNKDKIKFDEELVLKCLYISIEEVFKKHINTVYIYLWNKILNEYVNSKSSLERLLEIFERIIIISSDLSSKLEKDSLLFLAKLHPQEMWEKLSSILDNNEQNISRLFNIKNCWLSNGFLSIFDESSILKWIDEKENSRLNIISCLAPYYFLPTKKESDMAFYRRLLIKYPENKRLKQELRAQAMSGFSWGKTIDNLNEKISNIKNLMEDEEEGIIKDWLDELLDCYNNILKCEKEVAERRNF
jgi:CMP-2-keto-3-deoxyoctulosonic acid synthetase